MWHCKAATKIQQKHKIIRRAETANCKQMQKKKRMANARPTTEYFFLWTDDKVELLGVTLNYY